MIVLYEILWFFSRKIRWRCCCISVAHCWWEESENCDSWRSLNHVGLGAACFSLETPHVFPFAADRVVIGVGRKLVRRFAFGEEWFADRGIMPGRATSALGLASAECGTSFWEFVRPPRCAPWAYCCGDSAGRVSCEPKVRSPWRVSTSLPQSLDLHRIKIVRSWNYVDIIEMLSEK